jgi:hypothetical protein
LEIVRRIAQLGAGVSFTSLKRYAMWETSPAPVEAGINKFEEIKEKLLQGI